MTSWFGNNKKYKITVYLRIRAWHLFFLELGGEPTIQIIQVSLIEDSSLFFKYYFSDYLQTGNKNICFIYSNNFKAFCWITNAKLEFSNLNLINLVSFIMFVLILFDSIKTFIHIIII